MFFRALNHFTAFMTYAVTLMSVCHSLNSSQRMMSPIAGFPSTVSKLLRKLTIGFQFLRTKGLTMIEMSITDLLGSCALDVAA